jgi:hypothetical protein
MKPLASSLEGLKDKDKDKEIYQDKDEDKDTDMNKYKGMDKDKEEEDTDEEPYNSKPQGIESVFKGKYGYGKTNAYNPGKSIDEDDEITPFDEGYR